MNPVTESHQPSPKNFNRLKVAGVVLTLFGIALFGYFIYAIGFREIYDGVVRFGIAGFAVILIIYFLRIISRAAAWKLSVHEPLSLRLKDTIPAVIIGEALSSTIPIGIMISGTSKVIAVRKRIPMVAGFSSVATENLFYSLVTTIFLIAGAAVLVRGFAVDESVATAINALIVVLMVLLLLGFLLVIRQWHAASAVCEWIYGKGFFEKLLKNGRSNVRKFEDLIYGFYRHHPERFLPICLLEISYHSLGIAETWFILSRLAETSATVLNAFLLESVSRLITILFKLIPFVLGVDEAGAQFVGETLGLALGAAVTLAVIRKGRMLFWVAVGFAIIVRRGFSFRKIEAASE